MGSIYFPDIIAYHGNMFRVVTDDGRAWLYANTTLNRTHRQDDIPERLMIPAPIIDDMREEGLIVLDRCQHPMPL